MATAPTPLACQPIAKRLGQTHQQISSLQQQLQTASTLEKPSLAKRITQTSELANALSIELDACVLAHPPRSVPTETLSKSLVVPIFGFGRELHGAVQNMRVRFHNKGQGAHRHSTVDLQTVSPQGHASSRSGFPKDLGQLHSTFDLHFNDINSQSLQVLADASRTPPLTLRALFETVGTEVIIHVLPDKDLTLFSIDVDLDLGLSASTGLLRLVLGQVRTKAMVKGLLFGTRAAPDIETAFNAKVAEVLSNGGLISNLALTDQLIAKDRAAFDYKVMSVQREGDHWKIDYTQTRKRVVVATP